VHKIACVVLITLPRRGGAAEPAGRRVVAGVFRTAENRRCEQQRINRLDRKTERLQKHHITRLERRGRGRDGLVRGVAGPLDVADLYNYHH
jgi:hypothetical protein